jgi:mannose-6-phosphate isomerase-like protein (cupin superfamily)
MKRRVFVRIPFATAVLGWLAPALAGAQRVLSAVRTGRPPVLVKSGTDHDGKPFRWLDATFHVKVSGRDTEGRCVVFDTWRPEKVGPPLHLHTDCDEWFFVLDGTFKVQVGADVRHLSAGDSLLVPQETPHAFVKTSEGVARLIVMHQPAASMEEYFRTVIGTADQSQEGRRALAERHGMRFVGPPLTPD